MQVEQFVMAYGVEQDRLRTMLLDGFISLRPLLRINAEILGGGGDYLELNTAVELGGKKAGRMSPLGRMQSLKKRGRQPRYRRNF